MLDRINRKKNNQKKQNPRLYQIRPPAHAVYKNIIKKFKRK